jgi:hypothetical protein
MTATLNAAFTAAQFNQYVRDNLLCTEPALAMNPGGLFVSTAANAVAQRVPSGSTYGLYETTASTSYVALTHATAVTATTGAQAFCFWSCGMMNNTANVAAACSVAVSGASAVAASDDWGTWINGIAANCSVKRGSFNLFTGLTPGANTFSLQFRVTSGTGSFGNRTICVIPL